MQRYATFGMLLDFAIVLEYEITISIVGVAKPLKPPYLLMSGREVSLFK
jgi:hypothetical protein